MSASPPALAPLRLNGCSDAEALEDFDSDHALECRAQRNNLLRIARLDKREVWRRDGCRDMTEWVSMRLDVNGWKARRIVKAAHALERLPGLSEAFATARLCYDKVLELARFVTPENEERWIKWAIKVKLTTVRDRADVEIKPDKEETKEKDRSRSLGWEWNEDKSVLHHWGSLPKLEGKVLIDVIDGLAKEIPASPDDVTLFDDPESTIDARRADALMMLVSGGVQGKSARPKVVLHAELDALLEDSKGCELEGVGVIHPDIARRLLCDCTLEFNVYSKDGKALGIGAAGHDPPRWLRRIVLRRDKGCMYPGCSMTHFVQVNHIEFETDENPTDYNKLITLCHFHHKLVHEYGWRVRLGEIPGTADWFRPDGSRLRTGPAPPRQVRDPNILVA